MMNYHCENCGSCSIDDSEMEDSYVFVGVDSNNSVINSQDSTIAEEITPMLAQFRLEDLEVMSSKDRKKLEKPIILGISKKGYPEHGIECDEEERLVHRVILDKILLLGKNGPFFKLSRLSNGMIIVVCEDVWTAEWVKASVPLQNKYGCDLHVFDAEKLFMLDVALVLPLVLKDVPQSKIIKLLEIQNSGIITDHWKVHAVCNGKKGQALILNMDVGSVRSIQRRNYSLNLGLGKVHLRFPYREGVKEVNCTKEVKPGKDYIPHHGWLVTEVLKNGL